MVTGTTIERQIRKLDAQLNRLEHDAIVRLNESLRNSARNLERQVQRLYMQALEETAGQGAAIAEARARVLLQQVRGLLTITNGAPDSTFNELIRRSYQAGLDNALASLEPYQRQLAQLSANVPVEVAAQATNVSPRLIEIGNVRAANAKARLIQHGQEAARAIERHVTTGVIEGRGWRKTAALVRKEVGITSRSAERLVRTESVIASDTVRRQTYQERGVGYVQRISTADSRTCPFCAYRAGNVYRVDEAPAAIHPNDRCYNAPWRKEWQELGLTDDEWIRKHRKETLAKLEAQGQKPSRGLAPLEKLEGLTKPPEPVWRP